MWRHRRVSFMRYLYAFCFWRCVLKMHRHFKILLLREICLEKRLYNFKNIRGKLFQYFKFNLFRLHIEEEEE